MLRRDRDDLHRRCHRVIGRRRRDEIQERLQRVLRLSLRQIVEDQLQRHRIVRAEDNAFAPMWIEQAAGIEFRKASNQPAESVVAGRADLADGKSDEGWQFARAQRQSGDHAETAASAALQCPEEIRVGAGIGDPHGAVACYDLGLQQRGARRPVSFRETAKAVAQNMAGDTDSRAAATLHITAGGGRHRVINRQPPRTGADRHRGHPLFPSRTAVANETIVQGYRVHRTHPDQQRIRRIGAAKVGVSAALHEPSRTRCVRAKLTAATTSAVLCAETA